MPGLCLAAPSSHLATPNLLVLPGCFFADSQQDQSAGVLDQRLVADLAGEAGRSCQKLCEAGEKLSSVAGELLRC